MPNSAFNQTLKPAPPRASLALATHTEPIIYPKARPQTVRVSTAHSPSVSTLSPSHTHSCNHGILESSSCVCWKKAVWGAKCGRCKLSHTKGWCVGRFFELFSKAPVTAPSTSKIVATACRFQKNLEFDCRRGLSKATAFLQRRGFKTGRPLLLRAGEQYQFQTKKGFVFWKGAAYMTRRYL